MSGAAGALVALDVVVLCRGRPQVVVTLDVILGRCAARTLVPLDVILGRCAGWTLVAFDVFVDLVLGHLGSFVGPGPGDRPRHRLPWIAAVVRPIDDIVCVI
jgi:hypothetical protein